MVVETGEEVMVNSVVAVENGEVATVNSVVGEEGAVEEV